MDDAFDALRIADNERKGWIEAARVFTRFLDRVVDPSSVRNLERLWAEESAKPLAPAHKAWDLVTEARDAMCEDMPLTFEEVARNEDLTVGDLLDETRKWQDARRRRDEEVEIEVEQYIARFSGS